MICCGNCREREDGKHAVDVCSDNCIQVHNVRVRICINTNDVRFLFSDIDLNKMLGYRRETELQGGLVMAKMDD